MILRQLMIIYIKFWNIHKKKSVRFNDGTHAKEFVL